jgi:hypothetical protein
MKINAGVYLVQCGAHYKIGSSRNIAARLKAVQRLYPLPLVLCHVWSTSAARQMERHLHQKYAAQRIRGEWFQLNPADVARLLVMPPWPMVEGPLAIPKIYQCKRCRHAWPSRQKRPRVCPKCRSPHWDKPFTHPTRRPKTRNGVPLPPRAAAP